jgi:hypothetical protein
MHPRTRTASLLILLASSLPIFAQGGKDDKLLALVRNSHRAAVQSISTLACRFTIEEGGDRLTPVLTGDYWKGPDTVRLSQHYPSGVVQEELINETEALSLATYLEPNENGEKVFASRLSVNEWGSVADVPARMLFNFPGKLTTRLNLDRLLELTGEPRDIKKVTQEGRELIRLDLGYQDPRLGPVRLQIWFDPSFNYLARKQLMTWVRNGLELGGEVSILSYSEALPGIFIPLRSQIQRLTDRKPVHTTVVALSDVRVNEPIEPSVFRMDIPAGTLYTDNIEGKRYHVDARGFPQGAVSSAPRERRYSMAGANDQAPGVQTSSDTSAITSWLIIVTVSSLVGLGFLAWAWRYRRARARSAG